MKRELDEIREADERAWNQKDDYCPPSGCGCWDQHTREHHFRQADYDRHYLLEELRAVALSYGDACRSNGELCDQIAAQHARLALLERLLRVVRDLHREDLAWALWRQIDAALAPGDGEALS